MAATSAGSWSAKMPTSSGSVAGRIGTTRRRRSAWRPRASSRSARAAGHEVEADGVGAGADGGRQAGGLPDAADLHERLHGHRPQDRRRARPARRRRPGWPRATRSAPGSVPLRMRSSPTRAASKPSARQRRKVRGIAHARFGHHQAIVGDQRAQPLGRRWVDLERAQVAIVDTDETSVGGDGRCELPLVVRLHERLKAGLEA